MTETSGEGSHTEFELVSERLVSGGTGKRVYIHRKKQQNPPTNQITPQNLINKKKTQHQQTQHLVRILKMQRSKSIC